VSKLETQLEEAERERQIVDRIRTELLTALDMVQDPIFVHDGQFRIVRANLAYARHAGVPIQQVIGRRYWEVFPKGKGPLPKCRSAVETHREGVWEEEIVLDTGEIFLSRSSAMLAPPGRPCAAHVLVDVTAERQAAASLRAARARAERYFDVAGVMLLVIGADERVVSVNRRGCEILGLPARDIVGKNWFDSFIPESGREGVRDVFRAVMAGALGAAE
jgi:PAS domain S-box-containing protein